MSKLIRVDEGLGEAYMFDCPGCGMSHIVYVAHCDRFGTSDRKRPIWFFNKDLNKPTFSPSVLNRWVARGQSHMCHFYVSAGKIQFLQDSTHKLAGQTVEMLEAEL